MVGILCKLGNIAKKGEYHTPNKHVATQKVPFSDFLALDKWAKWALFAEFIDIGLEYRDF